MIDSARPGICYSVYSSPIGDLLLTSDGDALTGLYMCQHKGMPAAGPEVGWRRDDSVFQAVREQLDAYFRGRLRDFELPLRMAGTPFQHQVWEGLRAIPYGETISYAELARRIGRRGASRAVGSANGRNPISIVVPCHRVIAADGTLGGYGGGLDRKEWLLEHESAPSSSNVRTRYVRVGATLQRVCRLNKVAIDGATLRKRFGRVLGPSETWRRRPGNQRAKRS